MKFHNIKKFLLFFGLLLLLFLASLSSITKAQTFSPSVFILYSLPEERNAIEQIITSQPNVSMANFGLFDDFTSVNLDNYDFLIIVSSVEFSVSDEDELKIANFINNPVHTILTISPFLDEFGGDLEETLGIEHFDQIELETSDSTIIQSNLSLLQSVGQYTQGTVFEYYGQLGVFEPISSARIIASITATNATDEDILELGFPFPVVINATTDKANIITSSLSPIFNPESVGSDFNIELGTSNQKTQTKLTGTQVSTFFDALLGELVLTTLDGHQIRNKSPAIINSNPANNGGFIIPIIDLNLQLLLAGGLFFSFLLLFYKNIIAFFQWLTEKILTLGIFVFGVFYKVQDRILDHHEVLMNHSRMKIMAFLEHINHYGAHLREIKTITKLGTGSLLWHLQVLEDFGWIRKYNINKNTVFIAAEFEPDFDPQLKEIELKLQSKYNRLILETLLNNETNGFIKIAKIAEQTGISARAINRHLKKLSKFNLIELIKKKSIRVKIKDLTKLKELFESLWKRSNYDPSPLDIRVEYNT